MDRRVVDWQGSCVLESRVMECQAKERSGSHGSEGLDVEGHGKNW